MVKLHVKKGEDSQFLFETTTDTSVEDALKSICNIYNGRLKISRLCSGKFLRFFPSFFWNHTFETEFLEIEFLAKSGITLPYNMQGLTDEQITELKLVDDFSDKCIPSGGYIEAKDDLGRRNGRGIVSTANLIPSATCYDCSVLEKSSQWKNGWNSRANN
jgi:hypothetical protein